MYHIIELVDLLDAMVNLPDAMVDLPDAMVDFHDTMVVEDIKSGIPEQRS